MLQILTRGTIIISYEQQQQHTEEEQVSHQQQANHRDDSQRTNEAEAAAVSCCCCCRCGGEPTMYNRYYYDILYTSISSIPSTHQQNMTCTIVQQRSIVVQRKQGQYQVCMYICGAFSSNEERSCFLLDISHTTPPILGKLNITWITLDSIF